MRGERRQHLVLVFGERAKLLAEILYFLVAKLFQPLTQGHNRRHHAFGEQATTEACNFIGDDLVRRVGRLLVVPSVASDYFFQTIEIEQVNAIDLA